MCLWQFLVLLCVSYLSCLPRANHRTLKYECIACTVLVLWEKRVILARWDKHSLLSPSVKANRIFQQRYQCFLASLPAEVRSELIFILTARMGFSIFCSFLSCSCVKCYSFGAFWRTVLSGLEVTWGDAYHPQTGLRSAHTANCVMKPCTFS